MSDPMQKEFEVFAKTATKDGGMIGATAVVCTIVIDKGDMTITKVFNAKKKDEKRAEDLLLDWLFLEPNVQNANRLDIIIYMNYSPLETTSLSIVEGLQSLETQGKRVKVSVRFVTLHGQGEDDEDNEEHKIGLKALKKAGIKLCLFDEGDWLHLLDVLKDPTWIQKQLRGTGVAKKALRDIIQDIDDNIEEREDMTRASEEIPKVLE